MGFAKAKVGKWLTISSTRFLAHSSVLMAANVTELQHRSPARVIWFNEAAAFVNCSAQLRLKTALRKTAVIRRGDSKS